MPTNTQDETAAWLETNRWERGVSYIPYPDEMMVRASHALKTDAGVFVVDPIDVDGIDDLFAEFGDVAGVVILLDRHKRDSAAVANRHDVSVYIPEWMSGVEEDIDAPVERMHRQLPGTDYGVHKIIKNTFWQEAALYGDEDDTLVVPEAVGAADYFLAGDERLGVHPMLRLFPPKKLSRLDPERVLVGHGEGVMEGAAEDIAYALRGSRGRTPGLYAKNLKSLVLG